VEDADDGARLGYFDISLVNSGQSAVQVVSFAFVFDRSQVAQDVSGISFIGPELPQKLDGLHSRAQAY